MAGDLTTIANKLDGGERLSADDGMALYRTNDIFALGKLANRVRERKNGKKAFYIINLHINYSNVCYQGCTFCAFGKKKGEEGAYEMTMEEVFHNAEHAEAIGATEIHIVGGIHPKLPYEFYLDMLRGLRERHPRIHLKAFTAVEIDHFARISRKSPREVLIDLVAAGLNSMPGGGAEILNEKVWKEICGVKPMNYLDIHRTAHAAGLRSTATMLYGHVETIEQRIEHMVKLRELQDETKGFTAFIPLAFHPENTELANIPPATALTDLKVHAVARLMLDNFDHIKAYWIMTGVKMAQMLLNFGVDDLDGTVMRERIVHMAGATSPQELTEEELRRLIRESGRIPIRRDSLYREIETAMSA